jgi:cytochrome c-type biogenesis protein CcmH
MLWLLLALMTAVAMFAALWPLTRERATGTSPTDLAVYRDQLEEIERDRLADFIGPAEAEAARVEVSRRLIAAADARDAVVASTIEAVALFRRRWFSALVVLVVLPLGAASLYLTLGSPNLPGQPLSARISTAHAEQSLAGLIAQVEAHLEKNPDDGRGWEVIAPVYMRLHRFDDAVKARRNALRALGETAERQAALGEALIAAADGVVTAEAKTALARATQLDDGNIKAQFFLGLAAEQDGTPAKAAQIWRDLLARAPEEAQWAGVVHEALARVEGPGAAQPSPGPTSEDVGAASRLAPEQRDQMVRQMVERLATRLRADGSDVEGWLRLVRAYMVLGDSEHARGAVSDAHRALVKEPDKLRRLDDGVKDLGVKVE